MASARCKACLPLSAARRVLSLRSCLRSLRVPPAAKLGRQIARDQIILCDADSSANAPAPRCLQGAEPEQVLEEIEGVAHKAKDKVERAGHKINDKTEEALDRVESAMDEARAKADKRRHEAKERAHEMGDKAEHKADRMSDKVSH